MNYTKTKLNMHLKGIEMETYSSPFLRVCIGVAIVIFSIGICFALGGSSLVELARILIQFMYQ